ncbi:MAG TPA: chromosome segregation SMC family protein, partial [archaeon]|nr:chromosome segregation SMC family protein [archaeon]
MARIEKIVIQGFKSFKRRATIPFPGGISVITGPNGAGKSCIGDGILFVLGHSRSRALRAKKLQDLIFHGSQAKAGSDYASVTLYLDNKDKKLPFPDEAVSVSRRINMAGVSTYRINGRVVTRQEVVDTLALGGITPDGYNIIQQGDVTEIVEMDPIERRGILDDVSGISEYEDKKRKADAELALIAERVREATLILSEKENILRKLHEEREAALAYRAAEAELEHIRAALLAKDYAGSEQDLAQLRRKLEEKEAESAQLHQALESVDRELSAAESDFQELTKQVLQATSQLEVSRQLARSQAERGALEQGVASAKREMERLRQLIERLRAIQRPPLGPEAKAVLDLEGVHGVFAGLATVPKELTVAFEVAAGSHQSDLVVDTVATAVRCVKKLKEAKIGRARFLPLDKLQPRPAGRLPEQARGWLADLVTFDQAHAAAFRHVLGSTAVVPTMDIAKDILRSQRVRMVTLEGDLVEASGVITGGFYRKRPLSPEISGYESELTKLAAEADAKQALMRSLDGRITELTEQEKAALSFTLEKDRMEIDRKLRTLREQRRLKSEERLAVQQDVGKLSIQKARIEARFDALRQQWAGLKEGEDIAAAAEAAALKPFLSLSPPQLRAKEKECLEKLAAIGPVNLRSLEEFSELKKEFDVYKDRVDRISAEKMAIEDAAREIESRRKAAFERTLTEVAKHFKSVYAELTNGEADLALENPETIESGLMIRAQPPGKRLLNIDSMSGGEKTLTAFAFLFA